MRDLEKPDNKNSGRQYLPVKPFKAPIHLIVLLSSCVFAVELLVMLFLYVFQERISPVAGLFIDAPLLIILLFPALYFILYRPLILLVEERVNAEKALLRERDRLQTYLEVAGVIVLALDNEGRIRLVNRKGCEVLGFSKEEILGRKWIEDFIPERVRGETSIAFASILSGDVEATGYYETPVVTRSGEERTVLWHNSLLMENGKVIGALSSGEDITDRKKTEKALKESEARYRLVHNTAFDGIIIADARDRILDCNDSAAKIFGYPRDEFIGKPVSVIIPEKYKTLHKNGLKRFLETGESKVQGKIMEYSGIRKTGEEFPLELALNNFTLGGVLHFTAMVRDITERKRAERDRELIQARLSQSQKMEAIGRFAGGIAHDFNNILTAIRGNAELALEDLRKTDPAFGKIDGIITSVLLASKLTRQLLLFSRGQPFELVPLNINKVIEDLLLMIGRLIGDNITISAEMGQDIWTIEADEGNIEQVIMNLAVNAKDAMPAGGTLTIRTENTVIDEEQASSIPEARPGRNVCITVKDTGVGMERDVIPRIFEPFFTTKEAGKGTGFGLAVVYSIIKQHNGWISVRSAPGQGSIFKIFFPALERERAPAIEPGKEAGGPGQGRKILLVEDNAPVRELTITALAGQGYNVTAASDSSSAREAFEREKGEFDLILCDISLSDGNGIQLAESFAGQRPGTAVILTSGYLDAAKMPDIADKGYRYLQKPYSIAALLKTVSEATSGAK